VAEDRQAVTVTGATDRPNSDPFPAERRFRWSSPGHDPYGLLDGLSYRVGSALP
jgi:hypothetical protein